VKQDRTPQSEVKDGHDRLLARLHRDPWIDPAEAEQKLARQIHFETPMFGSSRRRTGWAAVFSMSPGDLVATLGRPPVALRLKVK
jgi:hypothetical protein